MNTLLTELKEWINEQKEVCQKGYIEATDDVIQSMYSSENAAFGIVIMKIDKLLSESSSTPVTGESEAIEERTFTLKEVNDILDDFSFSLQPIRKQYFKDKFGITI